MNQTFFPTLLSSKKPSQLKMVDPNNIAHSIRASNEVNYLFQNVSFLTTKWQWIRQEPI